MNTTKNKLLQNLLKALEMMPDDLEGGTEKPEGEVPEALKVEGDEPEMKGLEVSEVKVLGSDESEEEEDENPIFPSKKKKPSILESLEA